MALLSLTRSISSQYWLRKIRRFKSCNLCSNKARKRMRELPSEFWTSRQWPIRRREPSGARIIRVTRSAAPPTHPTESTTPTATRIPSARSAWIWLMILSVRCSKYSQATTLTVIRRAAVWQTIWTCNYCPLILWLASISSKCCCVCLRPYLIVLLPSWPSLLIRPDRRRLLLKIT